MGFILDQSVFGQAAGVKEAAADGAPAESVVARAVVTESSGTVVNEAFANPAAQRERRERDLVRFVLSHSRAELEIACLALGETIEGRSDEALREALFRHHRGVPQPSRLPL